MATAGDVLNTARFHLNDTAAALFTDAVLLPALNAAWAEIQVKLRGFNSQYMREDSSAIDVLAGAVTLASPPVDLAYPTKIYERPNNGTAQQWYPVTERAGLDPTALAEERIRYWEWRDGAIRFTPATTARELLIYYMKTISGFTAAANTFPIPDLVPSIAYLTASLAAKNIGKDPEFANDLKRDYLETLKDYRNTVSQKAQGTPFRRKPNNPYRT
jgi:hypothetical protein